MKHDCSANACPAIGHNIDVREYEDQIADLVAALERAADTLREFAQALPLLRLPLLAEAARIAETATRETLAKVKA